MAFVFRTNRPDNMNHTFNDVGPGQYISQKPFLTTTKQNPQPFMSNTGRISLGSKEKTPGPGTYNIDTNLEYMNKLLNTSQEKIKKEPFYRSLDYENNYTEPFNFVLKEDKNDQLGFMVKDKRFKYSKKDIDNPGPGSYITDSQFSQFKPNKTHKVTGLGIHPNMTSQKDLMNHSAYVQSPKAVVSIPAKTQCFGYEINQENSTIMNEDPEKIKKYTGVKDDIVGPGQYDLLTGKEWLGPNKGTSWSKSKTTKTDFTALKQNKTDDLVNSINERNFKKNEEIKERRMKNKEKMFKQLKIKNEMRKQNTMNIKQKNNNFDNVMVNETPGPGYYESTETSAFQRTYVPENYQTFGSTSSRFPPTVINDAVGPGAYFSGRNTQYGSKKRLKTVDAPFNSKSKRDSNFNEKSSIPGPGRYNPDKLTSHKAESKNSIFGSSNRRFSEAKKTKEAIPGPGSYLQADSWIKPDSNEFYKKIIPPKYKAEVKVEIDKEKEGSPPVGAYNPDMIYNLGYNVAKKITKFSMVNAPFNSMKRRFEDDKPKTSNNLVGPGYYYKSKTPNKEQIFPQFKSSEKRFSDRRMESDVGPGLYNQTSHFDWHKKTFNILYL